LDIGQGFIMRLPYLVIPTLLTIILAAAPVHANGSENVSLLGHWREGPCLALEAVDEIVYFGHGSILEIVDFRQSQRPIAVK
jgi:hypothetical protein